MQVKYVAKPRQSKSAFLSIRHGKISIGNERDLLICRGSVS